MPNDDLKRFLAALSPASREKVQQLPQERQDQLAAAWRTELRDDTDLDALDELSPAAGASEAAERVVRDLP
ncbi:hypothetical protein BLA24_05970 [Streptomyces cinnamoneus]|uniref:Uncharacterized protein n=1 Tax=Streptomyces cinnamoneus TaxID=53446 RepID=A0A2G1XNH9_STRCJ|nr:hypothetical protein [Streptomyces cinnamoneus]PHQ52805.1 hypothetical protein BLA24_05970 [Streptomyces cinnamoneus]PPT11907.1 hypothetical protein CYQ11_02445 [Streptomyces cinnamoneus]